MSQFSASITREVNTNVAKGRGPVGKSSRKTAYRQLLMVNSEEVVKYIRLLRTRKRYANQRSRVDDPHQLKWFLEESRGAIAGNLDQFKYFSSLLKRKSGKQPSQSVVAEFVVYLLGCPQHNAEFGSDIPAASKATQSVVKDKLDGDDDWESGYGGGASISVVESEWDLNGTNVDFDDDGGDVGDVGDVGGGSAW